eukprot:SAG11_NODE_13347_length_659_cov_0.816071_1_plen_134_part_10
MSKDEKRSVVRRQLAATVTKPMDARRCGNDAQHRAPTLLATAANVGEKSENQQLSNESDDAAVEAAKRLSSLGESDSAAATAAGEHCDAVVAAAKVKSLSIKGYEDCNEAGQWSSSYLVYIVEAHLSYGMPVTV